MTAAGRWPRLNAGLGHHALVLVTIAIIWGGVWTFLRQEYHQLQATAARDAAHLADDVEHRIVRGFEAVDDTLLFLRENILRDPAGFTLGTEAHSRHVLSGLITEISLLGPGGDLLQSAIGPPAAGAATASLPATGDGAGDALRIGAPVKDPGSGSWTLQCARRVESADGSFHGMVVASVDIGQLERFADPPARGRAVVLVAGTDGVIRAAAPDGAARIGQTLPASVRGHVFSGGDQGVYRAARGIDGAPGLISFRRIAATDLVVAVGLDEDAILGPYRRDRLQYLGFGAGLTLLVTAAGGLLARQRRRSARAQEALTATLENITQGVIMVDADGRVPVINRRAAELLALPQDLLERDPSFRDILRFQLERGEFGPPGAVDPEFIRFVESGGISREYGVYERVRADGTALEVRTRQLAQGGAVRTYTDITDRRANEEALAAARDAAEAAGRARSEFLAVISHEIRTPMNGILGVAALLLDMKLGTTEKHYVRIILDSGNHLLQLINDILDFSRLDAGRLELHEAEFEPRQAARHAIEVLAPQARSKGLALALEVADDVPQHACGDARRLHQVLLNLIGNAVKFTATGSVRVGVTRLRAAPGGVRLGFSVADTGIGIPAEAQAKLFTAFTQVDGSISRRFGGSGLGLAISRRLIERMGGTIGVESTPGLGSTFRFDILLRERRAASEPAPGAAPAGAAVPKRRGLRVLVAEDNATNRLVATRMLERQGHQVAAVTDGAEAVAAVQANPFDLVLMDVMMPEMDGLAATAAIRHLPGPAARIPIIGLTANAMQSGEAACIAAGMDHFATKPISADRLAEAIARVLQDRTGEGGAAAADEPGPRG